MLNTILELTQSLITIPSVKENNEALHEVINRSIKDLSEFTIERFEKNKSPSVLVYCQKKRPESFKIILNAHLDVVPANSEFYSMTEKDGKLYGRGTNDMKAAAAVEILVFKELAKKLPYPIALQLVTDEEVGGFDGVKHQLEQGVRCDFAIAGEPTDMNVNNKAKGIIWANIETKGYSAHGAYPWNGINAIVKMTSVLEKIQHAFPVPSKESWETTVNIAKISTSNTAYNKVPDDCTVSLDVRYIPEDGETIVDKLKHIAGENTIEIPFKEPAQFTPEDNMYVKHLQDVTRKITGKDSEVIVKHGGADVRHFNAFHCEGVTFGPVGGGLHTDDEWVEKKSLEDYYNVLKQFFIDIKK